MQPGGSIRDRNRRCIRLISLIAATGCIALGVAAPSGATVLAPWGSNLSATPTLDTANGASTQYTNTEPASSVYGGSADQAIATSFSPGCTRAFGQGGSGVTLGCTPWMHDGADVAVWNTQVAGGSATAPAGGQVLAVNLKGCTVEDGTAPIQYSQVPGESQQFPTGSIEFQDLTPGGDGSFTSRATSPGFQVPPCSNSADPTGGSVNTSTVTTYQPTHLCVNQGDVVGLFQSGGFIANGTNGDNSGPWYVQGAPVRIMAPVSSSGMDSFTDADVPNKANPPAYRPGDQPLGDNSGWGSESNQEVELQVIEGTGENAYGGCPGGVAVEPQSSNGIICVTQPTNPGDPFGTCNAQDQPVHPPQNTARPTIAVSSNGIPVTGTVLPGYRMDATPGSWTKDPNESFINYAYQWEDCDSGGANCTPISGQAGKNPYYYATTSDAGHTIEVAVSATNNASTVGPVSSAPTRVVSGPDAPVISVLKLNPSSWNAAGSSVITYYDSVGAVSTIKVLQNGTVVKTLTHNDTAMQYGGNGIQLSGLPAGSYQLQVAPDNLGAAGAIATIDFTVTSATPVITKLRVNPGSFNAAKGATVTYVDTQTGNATLRVLQCQTNTTNHKKKPKPKKHSKRQQTNQCAKVVKTLHHHDRAGSNGVKLKGVAAGRYQLEVVSKYAGLPSKPSTTSFTAKKLRHGVRHVTRQEFQALVSALVLA